MKKKNSGETSDKLRKLREATPPNAFAGSSDEPNDASLKNALGPATAYWEQFLADLARECAANIRQWKSYSPKAGWALRVQTGDKTLLWLSPSTGCFTVSFALGEKALSAAHHCGLSDQVLQLLDQAPRGAPYPLHTRVLSAA
jgi:hypothetical protein